MIYTNFASSKRLRNLNGFLKFVFSRRSTNDIWLHAFSRTSRGTKTKKLLQLPKYATNYKPFPWSIYVHEESHTGYLFQVIERVSCLLKACFIFPVFLVNFQRHLHSIVVTNMTTQREFLCGTYDVNRICCKSSKCA